MHLLLKTGIFCFERVNTLQAESHQNSAFSYSSYITFAKHRLRQIINLLNYNGTPNENVYYNHINISLVHHVNVITMVTKGIGTDWYLILKGCCPKHHWWWGSRVEVEICFLSSPFPHQKKKNKTKQMNIPGKNMLQKLSDTQDINLF